MIFTLPFDFQRFERKLMSNALEYWLQMKRASPLGRAKHTYIDFERKSKLLMEGSELILVVRARRLARHLYSMEKDVRHESVAEYRHSIGSIKITEIVGETSVLFSRGVAHSPPKTEDCFLRLPMVEKRRRLP